MWNMMIDRWTLGTMAKHVFGQTHLEDEILLKIVNVDFL